MANITQQRQFKHRFVAIPVAQGDAFFLETPQGSVLVDGGRSVSGFSELFQTTTRRDGVDILVVSHNDADHANGVLGFLDSGLRCQEVWLPARWTQVLSQALRPWEEVVGLLLEAVSRLSPEISSLEQYAETLDAQWRDEGEQWRDEGELLECSDTGWPSALAESVERASEEEWEEGWQSFPIVYPSYNEYLALLACAGFPVSVLRHSTSRVFRQALVAATRIRQIALAAFHRGIPVRWFEHSSKPDGGLDWLQPLDARQAGVVRPIAPNRLLVYLALTIHNRESLVFWAPPPFAAGGVLFTSDSDLSGVQLPSMGRPIVTAPHHGSAANKVVYNLVARSCSRYPLWVRSDGKFSGRPCQEYLSQSERFCTLCRGQNQPKQPIVFFACHHGWICDTGVQPCGCQ